jgi:predicted DNA-binding ribbon-helix-helix protein
LCAAQSLLEDNLNSMKRSIVIGGHKTSISIEELFWRGLRDIAAAKGMRVSELVAAIDNNRRQGNLSSNIRLFVLDYYQAQAVTSNGPEQATSSITSTNPK